MCWQRFPGTKFTVWLVLLDRVLAGPLEGILLRHPPGLFGGRGGVRAGVDDSGCRVWGLGLRIEGCGFRVWLWGSGVGFRNSGFEFEV